MIVQKSVASLRFFISALYLLFFVLAFQNIGYPQNGKPSATPWPIPAEANPAAQSPEDIIRVVTNLVTIPVAVKDRQGRYIIDLAKDDFQIFEDGVEQEIALFETVDKPVTVLLLIDVSGSMGSYLSELTDAANVFVDQMRPDDRLIAATFADNVKFLFQATRIAEMQKKVRIGAHQSHNTMLFDAIDTALKKMKKIQGRKAIVVFSDGFGDGIFSTSEKNLRMAEESEALIYTVQYETNDIEPKNNSEKLKYQRMFDAANNYMLELAKRTGGRALKINDISNLEQTFKTLADELSRQYVIGFNSTNVNVRGQRKQIRVRVRQPGLAVRARDSYVVGKTKK